jgi:predicted DsbA family dithiol-disulfide isomerase
MATRPADRAEAARVVVEIWSDVVCPWCFIGKRRFESALARFPHRDEVEVIHRSFELDPRAQRSRGGTLQEHLANKYGLTPDRAAEMNAHVTDLARAEGLDYHLEQARPGNTFDAHRLIHMAAEHGGGLDGWERLSRAYFSEGVPIGEPEALVGLAPDLGLVPADVVRMLNGEEYAEGVRSDEAEAQALGIHAVPFFVLNRSLGVSGAQPPEVLTGALQRAWTDLPPHGGGRVGT